MIPTIVFKYSEVYDDILSKVSFPSSGESNLSSDEIRRYIGKIGRSWRGVERELLVALSVVTGLGWNETQLDCYLVSSSVPFSEPLTIPIYKNMPSYFIDILIHEIIHRLFLQNRNREKIGKIWRELCSRYKSESLVTKDHILLHAVHQYIFLEFFNEARLRREIDMIGYLPDYKRSWEIVLGTGYKKIIKDFLFYVVN